LKVLGVTEDAMLRTDSLVSDTLSGAASAESSAPQAAGRPRGERFDEADELGWSVAPDASPSGERPAPVAGEQAEHVDRQAALRALRSLEATEARLERNARRESEEARGKLVQELLPVLDNLDRTIRAAHANRSDPAMLEGVRMVRHQLDGVLRGYGVERIDALDQRFDPSVHEAIGVTPVYDPRSNGVVLQQAEPGYRLAGKLLRPAKVNVGKLVSAPAVGARSYWR
jgi:molecular chaperone GrpE